MNSTPFSTLLDLLAYRAEVSPEKAAFTFNGIPRTFAELWRNVNRFAESLLSKGLHFSECVLIVLPNGTDFFSAFYGTQRAGGIAVPVPPQSDMERIFNLAGLCDARMVVVPSTLPAGTLHQLKEAGVGRGLNVVTVDENGGSYVESNFPEVSAEDVAFIQYTSGSTGNPKGVMLTHASLLTNMRQMIAGMEITADEIFVSWLPVYHDMGLILKTMVPFYVGAETHLLPTELRDVRVWMEALQSRRATFTAAPDFAFRLVLNRIGIGEYDLSSLRVALNAAEPVRAATIREFEKRFGLKNVMTAGYGLAEATVGVSMSRPGANPKVDGHGVVSVGHPFPGVEVRIVKEGEALRPGQAGDILIRSAARCKGYYKNPKETELLFQGDFIDSGDIGYLDDEEQLYIVGRKKNIIKHLGQTFAAQELEEIADSMEGVRFSVALGMDQGRIEGEQLFIFVEMRDGFSTEQAEELTIELVNAVHARVGIRPARVLFIRHHGIPRTHNGKIQHLRLKEQYLSGKLRESGLILYPNY
jgi:acyl-CoA synthetase (AMP-forming)/AMP-acid ligase II